MPSASTIVSKRTCRNPRRAVRKNLVHTCRLELTALNLIPAGRIAQQKIDALPGRRGLLCECLNYVAELTIGRDERIAIRAPGVVSGRTRKRKNDENAEHDHPEPQMLEPDCAAVG